MPSNRCRPPSAVSPRPCELSRCLLLNCDRPPGLAATTPTLSLLSQRIRRILRVHQRNDSLGKIQKVGPAFQFLVKLPERDLGAFNFTPVVRSDGGGTFNRAVKHVEDEVKQEPFASN